MRGLETQKLRLALKTTDRVVTLANAESAYMTNSSQMRTLPEHSTFTNATPAPQMQWSKMRSQASQMRRCPSPSFSSQVRGNRKCHLWICKPVIANAIHHYQRRTTSQKLSETIPKHSQSPRNPIHSSKNVYKPNLNLLLSSKHQNNIQKSRLKHQNSRISNDLKLKFPTSKRTSDSYQTN